MTIPTLHVPQKDSPQSALAAGINDSETVLVLDDSSIFEADAITRLTLGIDQSATEVVTISSYDGDNEITVVRGTPAYSWPLGTVVARVLNSDDINDIHTYLGELNTILTGGSVVTNGNTHNHASGDGAVIPEGGIGTGAVTASKIGTGAVTADKLGADSVDGSKIADNAINSEHIYTGAIDTNHIGNAQVTALKLAANSVSLTKLAADVSSKLVTNGDSHDHAGGDGAQIDHTGLSNIGTLTHAQLESAIGGLTDPAKVRVVRTTDVTLTAAALTAISWESESFDVGNMWTVDDPTKIYFPTAGLYLLNLIVEFQNANTTGTYRFAGLFINVVGQIAGSMIPIPDNGYPTLNVSVLYQFEANAYCVAKVQSEEQRNFTAAYLSAVRLSD